MTPDALASREGAFPPREMLRAWILPGPTRQGRIRGRRRGRAPTGNAPPVSSPDSAARCAAAPADGPEPLAAISGGSSFRIADIVSAAVSLLNAFFPESIS